MQFSIRKGSQNACHFKWCQQKKTSFTSISVKFFHFTSKLICSLFFVFPLLSGFQTIHFFQPERHRRQLPFPPCRPPENFWIWIQKNPSFYCPPWELFRRLRKRRGSVYTWRLVALLLGCCCCMFLASFNVAAYCLWSFDCWRLSRFLFLFLSLFFLLLLLLLWWWCWRCFLFARNTFFS